MMTASIDNFKGMKYYEISLEWKKPDGSKTYVENAKIYKQNKTLPIIPNKWVLFNIVIFQAFVRVKRFIQLNT